LVARQTQLRTCEPNSGFNAELRNSLFLLSRLMVVFDIEIVKFMKRITLISTIHEGIGRCNSVELKEIISSVNPQRIFVEALDETYSSSQKILFKEFGIFHKKLEIKAIQLYDQYDSVSYVPILDEGLSASFDKKYDIVSRDLKWRKMLREFNTIAGNSGFKFLNSREAEDIQEQMRNREAEILNDPILSAQASNDIDKYEDNMLCKIYASCDDSNFQNAVFLSGVAHRSSLIKKINLLEKQNSTPISWVFWAGE